MWKNKFIVCLHCAVQDGTETLEVVLMKTRSTSQHRGATVLVSLGSLTPPHTALAWSYCYWALSWCPCRPRGNGWKGALSILEDVSESSGVHCVRRAFVAAPVGSCSYWTLQLKTGASWKILVFSGKAKRGIFQEDDFSTNIWGFFVNVLMEIIYFHRIHSVLSQAVRHDLRSSKGDLLQKWGFTH